ncbi:hypothetical protein C5O27_05310 [Gordonia alkanivorans]|nr:hypothetical protein C5O27_05310 [Gordonia alkanivorans]
MCPLRTEVTGDGVDGRVGVARSRSGLGADTDPESTRWLVDLPLRAYEIGPVAVFSAVTAGPLADGEVTGVGFRRCRSGRE